MSSKQEEKTPVKQPEVQPTAKPAKTMTTATKITMVRIVLLPFILFFYISGMIFTKSGFFISWGKLVALCLFFVAATTDFLDGHIARKYNQVTDAGKLLDPIADKLLTLLGFVLISTDLVLLTDMDNVLPVWFAVLVLFIAVGRDYIINVLRQLAATKGKVIAADKFGKYKAVAQYFAIGMLMFYAFDNGISNAVFAPGMALDIYRYCCWFMLILATFLSVYSCINYIMNYKRSLTKDGKG